MRISYYLNTYSFFVHWFIFLLIRIMRCFKNVYDFFKFSITEISLCHVKPFCLGGSPKLRCLSVTNFGLPCLLYIVCETRSFVLGYFFWFFCLYSWFSPLLPLWLLYSLTFLLSRRHHLPVSLQLLRWACLAS